MRREAKGPAISNALTPCKPNERGPLRHDDRDLGFPWQDTPRKGRPLMAGYPWILRAALSIGGIDVFPQHKPRRNVHLLSTRKHRHPEPLSMGQKLLEYVQQSRHSMSPRNATTAAPMQRRLRARWPEWLSHTATSWKRRRFERTSHERNLQSPAPRSSRANAPSSANDLLNLLRAKASTDHPGTWPRWQRVRCAR